MQKCINILQKKKKRRDQFSSVAQSCLTLCDPMDCSTPGFPVHYQLPELAQTHVHGVGDAIQSSHPLSSPSPCAFSLSQHQGLLQWVGSLHQVAKELELQLQHQSFQWIFRTDFLSDWRRDKKTCFPPGGCEKSARSWWGDEFMAPLTHASPKGGLWLLLKCNPRQVSWIQQPMGRGVSTHAQLAE